MKPNIFRVSQVFLQIGPRAIISLMDLVAQQIETWQIHNRIHLYLIDAISEEGWVSKAAKGRSVVAQFAHLHSVRMMWLKAAAPELLEGLEKIEEPSREQAKVALAASGDAITKLLEISLPVRKVKNFKPHASAFVGYLIAHEAHHRGQLELTLRLTGHPIDDKASYGIWEWGVR